MLSVAARTLALACGLLIGLASCACVPVALFYFLFTWRDRMDDGGCYGGAPLWAFTEVGLALAVVVAAGRLLSSAIAFERSGEGSRLFGFRLLTVGALFLAWAVLVSVLLPAHEVVRTYC